MSSPEKLVEMKNIGKNFGSVQALEGVDFDLLKGEVHCLLGENGAGKSTLVKILSGLISADEGEIFIRGIAVRIASPSQAMEQGIGVIHQHFSLIQPLTVYQNFLIPNAGKNEGRFFATRDRNTIEEIKELARSLGMEIDISSKVSSLTASERQKLEIVRLLYFGSQIVILDEPTSMLLPSEIDGLFGAVEKMTAEGKGVIFVSHKLEEVKRISNRITVLRKGKRVGTVYNANTSINELVKLMIGEYPNMIPADNRIGSGKPVLLARGIMVRSSKSRRTFRLAPPIDSFTVGSNEMVGIVGMTGSGQKELFDAVYGLEKLESGQLLLNNEDISKLSVAQRIKTGLAYIPEDRQTVGLALGLSVRDNIFLKNFETFRNGFALDEPRMNREAEEIVKKFDIRAADILMPVSSLSGGNLQKTILAREMSGKPKLLLAYEPTKGLDIGATTFIRNELIKFAKDGSVLLYSEDLKEVMDLANRLYVVYEGQIIAELQRTEFEAQKIGKLMAGMKEGAEVQSSSVEP